MITLREMTAGDVENYAPTLQAMACERKKYELNNGMVDIPPCTEVYTGNNRDLAALCSQSILLAFENDSLVGYIAYNTLCNKAYISALQYQSTGSAKADDEYQLLKVFVDYIKKHDTVDTVIATVPLGHITYKAVGSADVATVVRLHV